MKRGLAVLIVFLFALSFAAAKCELTATLINQDPYPAIPGDYVKVVFQLDGISSSDCGTVTFQPLEEFPFTLDPGTEKIKTLTSGTYAKNYGSFAILPYQLRVNKDALDGGSLVEVAYTTSNGLSESKQFTIEIKDVKTDFEVSVDDFVQSTNKLSFSIINTGKNNAEAVVVELPKQENVNVKGASKQVIGSLNANDDTTFSYEALPKQGPITLDIYYTDTTGVRRTVEKTVTYDPSYFTNRIADQKTTSIYVYLVPILIVLIIIWRIWVYIKKKKKGKK
jgi:hypothetical protein